MTVVRDALERWLERLWYGPRRFWFYALFLPLWSASLLTRVASWRRRRPRRSVKRQPAIETVAIGNLVIGGSGKTPVVLHLAGLRSNASLAIVLRGYGGSWREPALVERDTPWQQCGDEALMLARRLPDVRVIVARDRAKGVELAKDLGCRRVLLDDGLQQRALEPTARVVVLGGESPLGNGQLLPLGPLRDPLSALREEDIRWVHGEGPGHRLPGVAVRSRTRAIGVVDGTGTLAPLARRPVFAFAGIARPERFFDTLRAAGADVRGSARFADHRAYAPADLQRLTALAKAAEATALICTEKDLARLPSGAAVYALRTELEVIEGEERVKRLMAG